jgi:hypothetical protein
MHNRFKQMFQIQEEVGELMKKFVEERRALELKFMQDCGVALGCCVSALPCAMFCEDHGRCSLLTGIRH